ncbi:MAG: type VII toxin-antitoxin system HepT family RNase toxin [Myxococcota bacterium]
MVDPELIAAKLADLDDRIARIRTHVSDRAEDLARDRDALDIVAFNLMLAVQACADVASHIISDEGWPAASGLAQSFQRLADRGVLDMDTARALGQAVGLRNVVAHGYARVDPEMVHAGATRGLDDLSAFARQVARWVASRG